VRFPCLVLLLLYLLLVVMGMTRKLQGEAHPAGHLQSNWYHAAAPGHGLQQNTAAVVLQLLCHGLQSLDIVPLWKVARHQHHAGMLVRQNLLFQVQGDD
jgi:hypothetical protein